MTLQPHYYRCGHCYVPSSTKQPPVKRSHHLSRPTLIVNMLISSNRVLPPTKMLAPAATSTFLSILWRCPWRCSHRALIPAQARLHLNRESVAAERRRRPRLWTRPRIRGRRDRAEPVWQLYQVQALLSSQKLATSTSTSSTTADNRRVKRDRCRLSWVPSRKWERFLNQRHLSKRSPYFRRPASSKLSVISFYFDSQKNQMPSFFWPWHVRPKLIVLNDVGRTDIEKL